MGSKMGFPGTLYINIFMFCNPKDKERWQVRVVGDDSGTLAVRTTNLDPLGGQAEETCSSSLCNSQDSQDIQPVLEMSEAMLDNGDFSAALALREGLLATWVLSLGNSHTFIATCLINLGQVHERRALAMERSPARKADVDQAERYYLEAVRRRIDLHGGAHVCVGQSWLYIRH